jgi:hypothetical protein
MAAKMVGFRDASAQPEFPGFLDHFWLFALAGAGFGL